MKLTRVAVAAVFVLVFFAALGPSSTFGQSNGQEKAAGRFIVVFRDDVAATQAASVESLGVERRAVKAQFRSALRGFAAELTDSELSSLRRNPAVAFVEPDLEVTVFAQPIPTGVDRIQGEFNDTANIDGVNDVMDVDIAVIDTGVDIDHPDLNVVFSVDCLVSNPCAEGTGDDDHSHGTHVAGTAAAIDNDEGVVGVAPGARIWSIKVLGSGGTGLVSDVVEGIDWLTAHNQAAATEDQIIDVANMSLGWVGNSAAGRLAIQNSVAEGVVYVVSAGNSSLDVYGGDGVLGTSDDIEPASYPEVATISAINDTDGLPGGIGPASSWSGLDRNGDGVDDGVDDSFLWMTNFSNQADASNPVTSPGEAIDLALPGADIYSTNFGGGYTTKSGTSMASPHAAGLAALYIVENGRDVNGDTFVNELDVYAIRQALIDASLPQADDQGLAVLNDADGNLEGIGWASDAVSPSPPTANSGGPYNGDEGSPILFDGSGSADSDGTIVTYAWDFDYDGVVFDTQASGVSPQFDYGQDGSYVAALRVFDDDDLTSSASTVSVTVNNVAPTADAGGPYGVQLGESVLLDATGSSDPGQDITSYDWDLDDDGQYDDASGVTYSFTPTSMGVLNIGLRVTDANSATGTDAATVTVATPPVLTSIDVSPSSASLEPTETQQFTATPLDQHGAPFTDEVSSTTSAQDPALVGNWKLDEGTGTVAGDSSTNGLDGTLQNGTQWIAGQTGSALSFDGVDDYVTVPYNTNIPNWTVAAWVRSPNPPSSDPAAGPVYRDRNFVMVWDHPAAAWRGVAGLRVGGSWFPASFGPLSGNTWYHLAATYDGETLRAYRDGVLITSNGSPSGAPDSEDDDLTFGRHSSVSNYFAGDVDEVYIYSRALTNQEISDLAVVGPSDPTPPTAPATLNATANGEYIELDWTASADPDTGISGYRIYRDTVSSGAKTLIAEISGASLSYTDTTTMPNTTYYYEVSALNGGAPPVEGGLSPEASDTTGDTPPAMPTGVTATGSFAQIEIDWDDNQEPDLSHYDVYPSASSGGPYAAPIASVPAGTSTYTDSGLGPDETFYYVVTAVDLAANSSPIAAQPVWSATGGNVDNIGFYTAGLIEGDYTVTASVGEVEGQSDITISDTSNQNPVAVDDSYNVDEDQALNVAASGVLGNDSDPNLDPITAVLISGPTHGTLTPTLDSDGSFTYDPDPDYNGPDSFTYVARDSLGADSNIATVNITVNPINDAPVAVNDSYNVDEDASLVVNAPGVLVNDSDPDLNPITAVLISGPTHGTLTPTLDSDGSFTYDPDPDYNGPDSFTYVARDSLGADSNIATVNITVDPVNDAPAAVDDAYNVDENGSLVVGVPGVLGNDTDIDLDPLTAELVPGSGPNNGQLTFNADGSFTYDPDPGYFGPDSFSYMARDTSLAPSNEATVDITVVDVALAPIHFATGVDTTIGALAVGKEDIVEFDGVATFSIYFDGSDVGLSGLTIDSISILSANEILLSFVGAGVIPDVGAIDPIDVVRFNAATLGDTTSGTFELYFDGSAVGLSGNLIFAVD